MAAGFHYSDAEQISNNNVLTDYNERTQPMPTRVYDMVSGANCERLKGWHFVTKERLNELDQDWRKDGDLGRLGVFLHAFQDSFSHKDFKTCSGQAFSSVDDNGKVQTHINIFNRDRWHEVDDPSKRPQLAFDMAKQTYDILIDALNVYLSKNVKKNKKRFFLTTWNSIKDQVWAFCNEKSSQKRGELLAKMYSNLYQNQLAYERQQRKN